MSAVASQITSVSIVYSTVCSGEDQRKHQISMSLAFVWGIHWLLVDSLHKSPVVPKMFPVDDVIMLSLGQHGHHFKDAIFIHLFEKRDVLCRGNVRPKKGTYYAVAMSVRKKGRIMPWQCPSVRPSVRPRFPDFSTTCFEISIWNSVYTFSRWHDMSSLSCITIGSL